MTSTAIIWAANLIDLAAAGVQVGSGAARKKKTILILQTLQIFMQGFSMLILGGLTGAINNVLSCLRNVLCYYEKLTRVWKGILIAASVLMTILFNTQGLLGWLPAVVCSVYILLMDIKDPVQFKLLVTLSFVPWCFYHLVLKSYTGAAFDAVTIAVNAVTLRKMLKGEKTEETENESV